MGQLTIPSGATVYADTSIFIYTIEEHPDYYDLLQPLWTQFQSSDLQLFSSELTLLETLVVPIRESDTDLIETYEQLLLFSQVQLLPITQAILREAANLRATTSLKTPDAIHAATALNQGCTLFLTNDSQFHTVSGLTPIVLRVADSLDSDRPIEPKFLLLCPFGARQSDRNFFTLLPRLSG